MIGNTNNNANMTITILYNFIFLIKLQDIVMPLDRTVRDGCKFSYPPLIVVMSSRRMKTIELIYIVFGLQINQNSIIRCSKDIPANKNAYMFMLKGFGKFPEFVSQ